MVKLNPQSNPDKGISSSLKQLLATLVLSMAYCGIAFAGSGEQGLPQTLIWSGPQSINTGEAPVMRLTFSGAEHNAELGYNPTIQLSLDQPNIASFELTKCTYQTLTKAELKYLDTTSIKPVPITNLKSGMARGVRKFVVLILPFRHTTAGFQRLVSYNYRLILADQIQKSGPAAQNTITTLQQWAPNTVMAQGNWFKLAITNTGIYKIDRNYLANVMGLDPNGLDPRNLKLYGHGGIPLPAPNATLRSGDIPEVPIWVSGEADGRLDANDYLVFYGQGTTQVTTDNVNQRLGHRINIYADTSYYYLTVGQTAGLRVSQVPAISAGTQTLTTVDHLEYYEKDLFNLLKSGREWYGDNFDFVTSRSYSFSTDGIVAGSQAQIRTQTLATGLRCIGGAHRSNFAVTLNSGSIGTINHQHNCPYSLAVLGYNTGATFNVAAPTSGGINLGLTYNKNGFNEAVGYLNWIEVQTKRTAELRNNYLELISFESLSQPISTFQIRNAGADVQVWDVTNSMVPESQTISAANGVASFDFASNQLKRFVAFAGSGFQSPQYIGRQQNQNLHAMDTPELIIITASIFSDQAQRLADFRRSNDGLRVETVTTSQIYAEYSSGKQDLVAIRDFLRSLYSKNPGRLKYVLLFGDCSFDYKSRLQNNTNFVPIFESDNTLNPINSYNSDDYIGFMDDNEGQWAEDKLDLMDVGVGRLIVKTSAEATQVVNKLINYANRALNLGNWRTKMTMATDNGDGLLHYFDGEQVVAPFESRFADFNVTKIHVAAYPTQSSPLGSISPASTAALNEMVNKGSLMINYAGHGNEFQWASEQLLTSDAMRRNWNNPNNLPFFVTATCDFGRYDDPTLVSGGEFVLLNPLAGGIGLVTTTRPVYANNNLLLNRSFTNAVFGRTGRYFPRLGDAILTCKNSALVWVGAGQDSPGNRSFALLGDPSMHLAYPRYPIVIDGITNQQGVRSDTIRALDRVQISGKVLNDQDSVYKDFNGELICTIYDKPTRVNLSEGSINTSFLVRNSIIYSGTATVTKGKFSLSFVTPLDINYLYGNGKISLYAKDVTNLIDGMGNRLDFKIGGSDEFALNDDTPPDIQPYINDTTFINGNLAGSNSTYLAHITDENGINLATSGIGHEMILTIDNDPNLSYVVSSYYTADANTYKSGWVNFPLTGISVGRHTAKLVVWDTYNNSSIKTIDFVVGGAGSQVKVERFITYPNPVVVGSRVNFVFSHNLAGETIQSDIEVFDAAGKLINTVKFTSEQAPSTIGQGAELSWDLTTASGQVLMGGTYFAKLKVTSQAGESTTSVIRLVVLP